MNPDLAARLRAQLAELVPGSLDLALPVAEELAACDPPSLPLLEDLHARLESANDRHRALEAAFAVGAIAPLATARQAVDATDDRRSDDAPLVALADAELLRRRSRQADLRTSLAAVPRDDLDRALGLAAQLVELEPDGADARQASDMRAARQRLDALHPQVIAALARPLTSDFPALLRDLSTSPWRLPISTALIGRLAQAIQHADAQRRQRRILITVIAVALFAALAVGFDLLWRGAGVQADAAGP